MLTWYAIQSSGVGFALNKVGEAGVDVKTTAMNTVVDNIRSQVPYGVSAGRTSKSVSSW